MEETKIELFLSMNIDKFSSDKLLIIKQKLTEMDDDKFLIISGLEFKSPTMMLIISIFFGYLGVDRFILGDTGMGVLKLLTGGCCGVLAIIDWFTIQKKTQDYNFMKFMNFITL